MISLPSCHTSFGDFSSWSIKSGGNELDNLTLYIVLKDVYVYRIDSVLQVLEFDVHVDYQKLMISVAVGTWSAFRHSLSHFSNSDQVV